MLFSRLLFLTFAADLVCAVERRQASAPLQCVAGPLKQPGPTTGCGFQGKLQSPDKRALYTAASLDACTARCFEDDKCVSFSYAKAKAACQLYGSALQQMGYTSATKGKIAFYRRNCFSADCPNILDNGDYEDGSWSPWAVESATSTGSFDIESPGNGDSTYAGGLLLGTGQNEYIKMYQAKHLTPGQQYVWSFDFKLGNERCMAQWAHHWLTPYGVTVKGHFLTLGIQNTTVGEWKSYTTYMTPLTTDITITAMTLCNLTDSSAVVGEYDNFRMSPFPGPVYTIDSPTKGPNLIKNGGFESNLQHYYYRNRLGSYIDIKQPGYGGSANAAHVTLASNVVIPTFLLFQSIKVVIGRTYTLSFVYKANQTTAGTFRGMLGFMSLTPRNYFAQSQLIAYDRPDKFPLEWTRLFGTWTAQIETYDLSFEFAGTGVEFYMDDVSIYQVDTGA